MSPAKPPAKVQIVPTKETIPGMRVILYGKVKGRTRTEVIAELEALGAIVLSKASKSADCALVGAEPVYSKALEREFLWKRDRVKSYGPKTLLSLLSPASKAATKKAATKKAATKKAATKKAATKKAAAKKATPKKATPKKATTNKAAANKATPKKAAAKKAATTNKAATKK